MSKIVLDTRMPTSGERPEAKIKAAVPFLGGSLPSFREWRAQNDAVMVPDKGFVKQLKKLDPDYEVMWDWGANRWEIWKCPKDREGFHVATVQTQDRTYRELGADILLKLQKGDPTRFTVDEMVAYFDEMDNQVQRRKAQDFKNKIEAIAKETFSWTHGILQVQVPQKFKIERMAKL